MAFKCSTQKQREHTGQRRAGRGQVAPLSASADHGASGGTCLGADMLLQLLKKYSLASGMKQAITVGEYPRSSRPSSQVSLPSRCQQRPELAVCCDWKAIPAKLFFFWHWSG